MSDAPASTVATEAGCFVCDLWKNHKVAVCLVIVSFAVAAYLYTKRNKPEKG